jgi:hypothetical protein
MNSALPKPNPRYDHVYAIVRVDTNAAADVPLDLKITVKKVVADSSVAAAEIKRLNELNAGKGCYYFSQITRLEKGILEPAAVSEAGLMATEHK